MLSSFDLQGGGSRAAYRLHQGLLRIGLDSQMLVQNKTSQDATVLSPEGKYAGFGSLARRYLDALPLRQYPGRPGTAWSPGWLPGNLHRRVARQAPDVINVQWVCDGFLPVQTLGRLHRPLILTLQDAWTLTGGCHYPYDCLGYQYRCGACPQLGSSRPQDLSRRGWQRKADILKSLPLTVVAISHWLGDCARASSLFRQARIEVIPNGLDTQRYQPRDTSVARQLLGLPPNRRLVLFGAVNAIQDPRKGAALLFSALKELHQAGEHHNIELVVFGDAPPAQPPDLGFPTHYLGFLHDDISLTLLYSAADVMVVPSVQEAFGQTATEACACGTPVVAFDNSGVQDVVEHQKNGYLARGLDASDLARGIAWTLADPQRHQALRQAARHKAVSDFDLDLVARRYRQVFQDALRAWPASAR
jgi:glycosyltransferase involved in cell wall biosynthesis